MSLRFDRINRREFLVVGVGVSSGLLIAACGGNGNGGDTPSATSTGAPNGATDTAPTGVETPQAVLEPTPSCIDEDDATPEQTEGPYYTPDTPERASFLEDGVDGTSLVLSGSVVSTTCAPIAGALVDFWHCDAEGIYDNEGYTLRGHQFADENGRYQLETIVPGIYPGRTRHIHVKVQAPDEPVLTTQLYFPNEPQNASDGIFREECLIQIAEVANGQEGTFDFVLAIV